MLAEVKVTFFSDVAGLVNENRQMCNLLMIQIYKKNGILFGITLGVLNISRTSLKKFI